jgi:hypothetical protein
LAQVRALGVTVRINNNNIALRPFAAIPDRLKAELRTAKPDLLILLRAEAILQQPRPAAQPPISPTAVAQPRRDAVSEDENFQIIDWREAIRRLDWADVILCWQNVTRHRLNSFIRSHRRHLPAKALPNLGEPVMCLENHPSGIMNGEIFTVRDFDPVRGILLEDGPGWIPAPWFEWLSPGGKQPRRRAAFALGYAITTHKSQGSEWPHVLVLDEFTGADRARWLYTAITRASVAVRIVAPHRYRMCTTGITRFGGLSDISSRCGRVRLPSTPPAPAPGQSLGLA